MKSWFAEQQIHLAEAVSSGKGWQEMSLEDSLGLAWKGLGMQNTGILAPFQWMTGNY